METNPLKSGSQFHEQFTGARTVDWTEPGLVITRLRLVSDQGYPYWDVTYCTGEIDGEPVRVGLPFSEIPRVGGINSFLIQQCNKHKLNGKKLKIFTAVSTLL